MLAEFTKPKKPDPTYVLDCARAIRGTAAVMEWAATRKYNPYPRGNYMLGTVDDYKAALTRHLLEMTGHQLETGKFGGIDPESNLPHVYHVAANALILAEIMSHGDFNETI